MPEADGGYWILDLFQAAVEMKAGDGQAPPRHFDLPLREEQYISTHTESVVGTYGSIQFKNGLLGYIRYHPPPNTIVSETPRRKAHLQHQIYVGI